MGFLSLGVHERENVPTSPGNMAALKRKVRGWQDHRRDGAEIHQEQEEEGRPHGQSVPAQALDGKLLSWKMVSSLSWKMVQGDPK